MAIRPHIQREIDATEATIARLQQEWPAAIAIKNALRSSYYFLPYFFLEAFPSLTAPDVRPLAVFGRLLAGSIFLHDRIVDRSPGTPLTEGTLRVMAMQYEAYHVLHGVIPHDAPFWDRCRKYVAEYGSTCIEERQFTTGERPWSEYDDDVGLRIVLGKNCLSRTIVAGLVEIGKDESLFAPLVLALDAFNLAAQTWDDIQDWKDDLRHGIPSLLLSRVVQERPAADLDEDGWKRLLARLSRALYYEGHALHVIDAALASLERAEALRPAYPDLSWLDTTGIYKRRFTSLRSDIERIVRENVGRAQKRPEVTLDLPAPEDTWQETAWGALRYVVHQWNLGFGEARDMVQYPKELGFWPPENCYFGDAFQRAVILDTLSDVGPVDDRLQSIIAAENEYLFSKHSTSHAGGWSYFYDLEELPPDADTLAQVIQAIWRSGRRDRLVGHCHRALTVLFRDCTHPDGSFETWIVPTTDPGPLEKRHAEMIERLWRSGPDCDVIPNLLYALHLYDHDQFHDVIERGLAYIERAQQGDGTWPSRWYKGPYYAVHVALRALTTLRPQSTAIPRAAAFLREKQNRDGGFGVGAGPSDALSTSLAMLGLASAFRARSDRGDVTRAEGALEFLRRNQSGGSWPAHDFTYKGLRKYYGSRTMTTAFVLKASLAWRACTLDADPSRRT